MLKAFAALLTVTCHFFAMSTGIPFLHCFYDTGFRWTKKKTLLILIFSLIAGVFIFLQDNPVLFYSSLLITPIEVLLLVHDYTGKKFIGFMRLLSYWIIAESITSIYTTLLQFCMFPTDFESFDVKANELITLLIVNILGTFFFSFAFFYMHRLYRRNVVMLCGKREKWQLLALIFLGFVLMNIITLTIYSIIDVSLYALAIIAILFAVLSIIYIYSARISRYYQERTAIQDQHMQAELAHFRQYQHTQEETSRFRHDIRNNLLCINDMLAQGKSDEAWEYLRELLKTVENLTTKYVTGDTLLDSIVAVKAQVMKQHNIRFELDGVLAGGLTWKPMDICSVFANALDNAIEACQKVDPEKRSISMNIKSTPQFWFVTIQNSVAEAVDISKLFLRNGGYTSKPNAAEHGIGTYNMKYTVESYGAMLKAECSEEIFTLEIMIDKSSPE